MRPARTAYHRRGAGAPLLLVPGAAATFRHWGERLLTLLAARFDVVALDHRGVGRSAPVCGPFTLADLADDAAALLDEIGWDRAHIAGVSMGGQVAQEIALRHPEKVVSLFLGCTHAGRGGRPAVVPPDLSAAVVPGNAEATAHNVFRLGVRHADEAAWAEYREAVLAGPVPPRTTALQIGALAAHGTADRLHLIDAPTLVVHGEADRVVPLAAARQLTEGIPRARLVVLPAGHLFWLEQPESAAELIAESASSA